MDTKKQAIKRFHVLLMQCGITDDGKAGILSAYGVESSTELDLMQLNEINNRLEQELPQKEQPKRKSGIEAERRRCMAATGRWLARKGYIKPAAWGLPEWQKIQRTICRAAREDDFWKIPLSKLRALTYEFNKQREVMDTVATYINHHLITN